MTQAPARRPEPRNYPPAQTVCHPTGSGPGRDAYEWLICANRPQRSRHLQAAHTRQGSRQSDSLLTFRSGFIPYGTRARVWRRGRELYRAVRRWRLDQAAVLVTGRAVAENAAGHRLGKERPGGGGGGAFVPGRRNRSPHPCPQPRGRAGRTGSGSSPMRHKTPPGRPAARRREVLRS